MMKFLELEMTGEATYMRFSEGIDDQMNNLKLVAVGQHGTFSGCA
jgi:hypothetical protein